MLAKAEDPFHPGREAVPVLTGHLTGGDPVIRAAAARALGSVADSLAAPALARALLDEDPDVRTDAMGALAACATPAERAAILGSLRGDPVPEVKVAAVRALGRLGGDAVIALLTRLVADRAEDDLVWDDTESVWDDWLDVQTGAVAALGRLGVVSAIPALLAARRDEFGQDLDISVFAALAAMGEDGVSALLGLINDPSPRVRTRALAALSGAAPAALARFADRLVQDPAADIRVAGLAVLRPDDPRVDDLMLRDPNPAVRRAAVRRHGAARPAQIARVLADPAPDVVAEALALLLDGHVAADIPDLAENLESWAVASTGSLAVPSLRLLARLAPARAAPLLCAIALDDARDLVHRTAAIRLVPAARAFEPDTLAPLTALVARPACQIRLAALAALAGLCADPDPGVRARAAAVLTDVIAGRLDMPTPAGDAGIAPPDAAAPKGDPDGGRRITITPDGDIVEDSQAGDGHAIDSPPGDDDLAGQGDERDDRHVPGNVIPVAFPKSTLGAIQQPPAAPPGGGPPARSARRRVSVDGPDDYSQDVRAAALGVLGQFESERVDAAIIRTFETSPGALGTAALRALGRRGSAGNPAIRQRVCNVLGSEDPGLRLAAAEALSTLPGAADLLAPAADDPDPNVRALALAALARVAPDRGVAALRDPSSTVRQAVALALARGAHPGVRTIAAALLRAGHADTVKTIARGDLRAVLEVCSLISDHPDDRIAVLGGLDVIEAARDAFTGGIA
ncbi:MAG: HEAT repeat domain-containing protein [Pseudomonadota bacterium]